MGCNSSHTTTVASSSTEEEEDQEILPSSAFDEYGIIDDIKYLILQHLTENEIFGIVSRLNYDFHKICINSLNHVLFDYRFQTFWDNMLLSSGNKMVRTKYIYIQCPWDYLWYKMTLNRRIYHEIEVLGVYENIPCNFGTTIENKRNHITNNSNNNNNNNKIRMPFKFLYDGADTARMMPQTIYNTLKKTRFNNNYVSNNILTNLAKEENIYIDSFGHKMVDVKEPLHLQMFEKIPQGKNGHELECVKRLQLSNPRWLCGIIDINGLNIKFPNWKKESEYYHQIPVLIDMTDRMTQLFDCSKFFEIAKNWINIYILGNNRIFIRIWYDCNKRNILNFGEKTSKIQQYKLLATVNRNQFGDNVANYRLTLHSMMNKYLILDNNNGYNCDYSNDDNSDNNKNHSNMNELYCRLPDGKISKGTLHREFAINSKPKIKHDYILFGDANINKVKQNRCYVALSRVELKCNNDVQLIHQPLEYFYDKLLMIDDRPIVNFDLKSIVEQVNQNSEYFIIHIKPKHIALVDKNWEHKWSYKRLKNDKENKSKSEAVLGYDNFFPMCFDLINESDFDQREWKVGEIAWKSYFKPAILSSNKKLMLGLSQIKGQIQVKINITKEFDTFQEKLKRDWIVFHPDEKWDNRKYFINFVEWDQKTNQVFYKYWVHLDDTLQVKSVSFN